MEIKSTEEIEIARPRRRYTEDDGGAEDLEFIEVRKELARNPNRKMFAYIDLDNVYRLLMEDYEQVRQAFLSGADQRAYDRLVSIVEKNTTQVGV